MTRAAVTITPLVASDIVADVGGDALDDSTGHVITPPPGCPVEELVIRITNTTNGAGLVTVLAGESPPADAADQGDLPVTLADGDPVPASVFVGPLTSARFMQADGTIHVDVDSGTTGFIAAFQIPRNA